MKFTLKIVFCMIVIIACTTGISGRSSKSRSHRKSGNHDAPKENTEITGPSKKNEKKSKICCHIEFNDEQSKKPGAITSIHVWGKESRCIAGKSIKATTTKFSYEECMKQEKKKTPKSNRYD